jgi:hypothetical protein
MLRRSSSAVATRREGHHWPRLNLEVPYRRLEWALRRAHRELSCRANKGGRPRFESCTAYRVGTTRVSGHAGAGDQRTRCAIKLVCSVPYVPMSGCSCCCNCSAGKRPVELARNAIEAIDPLRAHQPNCVACQTLAHGDQTHRNCPARRARREEGASSGMRTRSDASVHAHGPSLITTHASVIDLVLSMEKVSVRSTLAW